MPEDSRLPIDAFPALGSRRRWLQSAACGMGGLALADLLVRSAGAESALGSAAAAPPPGEAHPGASPLAARPPMFPPRARRIIFVFMQGGPSQVDTFDYKPRLEQEHGARLEFRDSRRLAKTGMSGQETVLKSPWSFRRYGECGQWVSDLFPEIARHVDKLCFIHSMQTTGVAHGPATLFLHTGASNFVRPSMGAWISYGLGCESQNLPGFVTIAPSAANGGPRNYASAFLPACFQGSTLGRAGQPVSQAAFPFITNTQRTPAQQRRQLDLLSAVQTAQLERRAPDDELEAVVSSYELAFRMQLQAPGAADLSRETQATQAMYGIGEPETDDFGRQCLLARRLAEAGVRFIQVSYADNTANPRWDQHSKIADHALHAKATDKPVAGLLADLHARGLLEDTLVWWGGEFGRNPFAQGSDGRDHNPQGFTHFLAGGGVKAGFAYGATDEYGHEAVVDKVHMHDLHATLLHLLGIDHERLTYRFAGRDFRLTDVHGRVVEGLLA